MPIPVTYVAPPPLIRAILGPDARGLTLDGLRREDFNDRAVPLETRQADKSVLESAQTYVKSSTRTDIEAQTRLSDIASRLTLLAADRQSYLGLKDEAASDTVGDDRYKTDTLNAFRKYARENGREKHDLTTCQSTIQAEITARELERATVSTSGETAADDEPHGGDETGETGST